MRVRVDAGGMDVGIVTVGDELLTGNTINSNATWLGQQLDERGVDVRRVTVVGDVITDIVQVVCDHRDRYDAVIVTGGLGPTHDDRTMQAIAVAFDRPLVEHPAVVEWLADERGYEAEALTTGTADLPEGATPLHNGEGVAPGARLENVYVLPGVPSEMKAMFQQIADEFEGVARFHATVRVAEPESALVERLDRLRHRFDVQIGSYPGADVLIRIVGEDADDVEAAAAWLRERSTLVEAAGSPDGDGQPDGGRSEPHKRDQAD